MHSISQTADDPEPARSAEQNEAFAELLTLARDRRAEFDAQLSLGDEVMGCLRRAGVFRAMVSREFGGVAAVRLSSLGRTDRYRGWLDWLDRQSCGHVAYGLGTAARNLEGHFPAFSGHFLRGTSFTRAGHAGR